MAGELIKIVSACTVQVDEFEFGVEANSLSYKDGTPERDGKGADDGNVYWTENSENAVGQIKFAIKTTSDNVAKYDTIKTRTGSTVKFFTKDGSLTKNMKSGVNDNKADITTGSDGKIEFNFLGTPLQ